MKTPLKIILKNFLNHVEDIDSRTKLSDDQYETEFQELKKLTDKLKEDSEYSCSCGLKDVNRPKNRYKDIVPYDISRVVLPKFDGIPGSDYINASHVKGSSGALAYIAAQGPLPNTVIDFWRMIWMCDVQVIVMACNVQEAGRYKCELYWPEKGEISNYGNISVELINTSQVCKDFLVRTLLVKCESEMRDVYQFHYTTWPDHGVPEAVQPILELVRLMRDCQASETVPILLHCSAGCGRTGTICAVDFVWACLRHGKLDKDFSLFQIALELRRQRIAMIQTKEQYILAHKAVATMFEQQLKVIDCHIYENIDEDGEPLMWKELQENNRLSSQLKCLDGNNLCKDAKSSSLISSCNYKENNIETSEKNESKSPENVILLSSNKIFESSSTISSFRNETTSNRNSVISNKTSDGSYSRNSYLSQQSNNEDSIPFIDEEEEVSVRPHCGRAYLNMPSCDSISKLINAFDPFVDKLSLGTGDSSPESEGTPNGIQTQLDGASNSIIPGKEYKRENSADKANSGVRDAGECEASCMKIPEIQKDGKIEEKSGLKVGKATVVRRPSISKLKALFERPSSSGDRSSVGEVKRSLFRNHSHHESRAGSAPPSLNCMDKNAATERESVLMMVTRKFRSSSVKSEHELTSKKNQPKKSAKGSMTSFKESINSLSRTMSLNLNKTFKVQLPTSKTKQETFEKGEHLNQGTSSKPKNNTSRFKLPDLAPKGKSMWYDKSSLPRAVCVVKPTENKSEEVSNTPKNTEKSSSSIFNVIDRPPRLLPFLTGLNKTETKDSSTMWYQTSRASFNDTVPSDELKSNVMPGSNIHSLPKNISQVQSKNFLDSSSKVNNTSKYNFGDKFGTFFTSNSKFYTPVDSSGNVPPTLPAKKNIPSFKSTCPIPDEVIPLEAVIKNEDSKSSFWPSSSLAQTAEEIKDCAEATISSVSDSNAVPNVSCSDKNIINTEDLSQNTRNSSNLDNAKETLDIPPAIPKKIGKNKGSESQLLDAEEKPKLKTSSSIEADELKSDENKTPTLDKNSLLEEHTDLYSNVNITAIKNIEQIESTLRNNPRGAIIDLTSRQSYSMEEELVNAVEQLAAEQTSPQPTSSVSKPLKSKFPGYEVIWPESDYDNKIPNSVQKQVKTGLCYSPPLRRNVNTAFAVTKSQSCVNLDWMELTKDSPVHDSPSDKSLKPDDKLVNKAVVELNTLLNQLTTRTLAEDSDSSAISGGVESLEVESIGNASSKNSKPIDNKPSQTKVTNSMGAKTFISVSTSKDEEIIFRFPPPPPIPPPPEEDNMSESFQIICKNGALLVANASKQDKYSSCDATVHTDLSPHLNHNDLGQFKASHHSPKPLPRKSKHTGIQRSASYTMIPQCENKKCKTPPYENLFTDEMLTHLENNKTKYENVKNFPVDWNNKSRNTDVSSDYKAKYALPKKTTKPKSTEHSHYANINKGMFSSMESALPTSSNAANYLKTDGSELAALKSDTKSINSHIESRINEEISLKSASTEANTSAGTKEVADFPDNTFHKSSIPSCTKSDDTPAKIVVVCDGNSNYGKIIKVPEALTSTNNTKDHMLSESEHGQQISQSEEAAKRKPLPSKKSERAPLPPTVKVTDRDGSGYAKIEIKRAPSPKKSPSRKQERAPPPPASHLLQKSSSKNVSLTKLDQNPYANFSALSNTKKLPALYENISDVQNSERTSQQNSIHSAVLREQKTTGAEVPNQEKAGNVNSQQETVPADIFSQQKTAVADISNLQKTSRSASSLQRATPAEVFNQHKTARDIFIQQKTNGTDASDQHKTIGQPKAAGINVFSQQVSSGKDVAQQKSSEDVDFDQQKPAGYGLLHSQSDVSVFRSIKERRLQYQGIPVKTYIKPLPSNKTTTTESSNSSDSGSSYEHLFPTKPASSDNVNLPRLVDRLKMAANSSLSNLEESSVVVSQNNVTSHSSEQSNLPLSKEHFKKNAPTAPPRSRRRSTTEINYAKVKSKGSSLTTSAAAVFKQFGSENQQAKSSTNGDQRPPQIPTKTKESYEFPERFSKKDNTNKPSRLQDSRKVESHPSKSQQDFGVS